MKAVLWLVLAAPFLAGAALAADGHPNTHGAAKPDAGALPPDRTDIDPMTPARLDLSMPHSVEYPALSRRLNEQGIVSLTVEISDTGRILDVTVRRSSGFERLDQAAVAAVRNWTYSPAHNGARALASIRFVDIPFRLVDPPPPPAEP